MEATQTAVQTYAIDPSHSRLGFTVRHLGFSKVRGRFEVFEGQVQFSPQDLSTLDATASAQSKSVTTGDVKRDEHLRSADFFGVETNPELTFQSSGVSDVSGQGFKLHGDLTMNGVTKPVVFDAEFLGTGGDPWGGTRAAFEAQTTIDRREFDLTWNAPLEAGGFLVGHDVQIELEIQAVQQSDEG